MIPNEIREGSLSQLWKISSSLMISFFSMLAMIFCDRLFLANSSVSALNAAASAGTLYWAGSVMFVTLCSMAEVFVAQYNGAKRYKMLGEPVWQMIWVSLFSCLFFCWLSFLGSGLFYQSGFFNHEEVLYYKWNNFFAPCFALLAAISTFFIGQGKTAVIKWMAILGNIVNVILDPLLIFGVEGWIPSMGIRGAAIATGLGVIVQIFILGALFLRMKNHTLFGSRNWKFHPIAFWKYLKVGIPPAIFITCELIAWALFYKMMEKIGPKHILVCSITQSVLLFLFFFGMALEKGTAAISGNLIGAKRFCEVKRVFKSGLILTLIFSLILALILIGFPTYLIDWFFQNPMALQGEFSFSPELLVGAKSATRFALGMLVAYITFENIRFVINGILVSAGDTLFVMISGICSIWLFILLPTYFFMVKSHARVEVAFYIWILYSLLAMGISYLRFASEKWRKGRLIEEATCT